MYASGFVIFVAAGSVVPGPALAGSEEPLPFNFVSLALRLLALDNGQIQV